MHFKISWLQPQSAVALETKKIKSATVSIFLDIHRYMYIFGMGNIFLIIPNSQL